jgi:hypothetical protein
MSHCHLNPTPFPEAFSSEAAGLVRLIYDVGCNTSLRWPAPLQ